MANKETVIMGFRMGRPCLLAVQLTMQLIGSRGETCAILWIDLDFGQHECGSLCHYLGQEPLQRNSE